MIRSRSCALNASHISISLVRISICVLPDLNAPYSADRCPASSVNHVILARTTLSSVFRRDQTARSMQFIRRHWNRSTAVRPSARAAQHRADGAGHRAGRATNQPDLVAGAARFIKHLCNRPALDAKKGPGKPGPFPKGGTSTPFYAACAVSACRLTSDSAIWLSVLSVAFSSFNVASSNFTASL